MSIHTYKCACKQCGRIIELDTCNDIVTVSDFLLDEVYEVKSAEVILDAEVENGVLMHVNNLDFIISNKAKVHFMDLLAKMKGEGYKTNT